MAKSLPFQITTAAGDQYDLEFPLHPETLSSVRVSQMLTATLDTLDHEISILGDVGNGDILQALAMAIVVRIRILPGQTENLDNLVRSLLESALAANVDPAGGNLPPGQPKEVH